MAYIGVSPSNGVRRVHTYTATASQTTFSGAGAEGTSLSYKDSNFVDVYQNGIKLGDADYTSTSGTSIVLAQGASVNDLVVVVVFDVFSVADTVSKADGGTFDGNVTMAGTLGVTGATTLTGGVSGNTTFSNNLTVSGAITGTTATLTTADNNPQLTLISTDEDLNEGPVIDLKRNSASPADDDNGPRIKFTGKNDAAQDVEYARVRFNIQDVTDGTEDGQLDISTMINGSLQNRLYINDTGVVINDAGVNSDFRVEGNNDANLFICDAGNDDIYIHRNNSTINSTNHGTVFNSGAGNSSFKTSGDQDAGEVVVQIYGNDGKCFIYGNGNVNNDNGSFGNFSDQTLKENIVDAQSQWADIKALQIRNFNLIASPDLTQIGVVAQELETAGMNGLVYDAQVDDDGNTKKAVKTSVLYMKAVKALQEAMTRIETLEAKVTALENAE